MDELEILALTEFSEQLMPTEHYYMLQYFPTEIEKNILIYWAISAPGTPVSRLYNNFTDHTGMYCTFRWFFNINKRIKKIKKAYEDANAKNDIRTLMKIKSGELT